MSKTYLEVNEVELLEKQATNLRDRLLLGLFFHLGCRISEALALTPQDIDLKQGAVTILHLKAGSEPFAPAVAPGWAKATPSAPVAARRRKKP